MTWRTLCILVPAASPASLATCISVCRHTQPPSVFGLGPLSPPSLWICCSLLTRTLARVYCFLWLQLNWQLYRRPCGSYKWILCSVRSTLCFSCHGPYRLLSKLAHACALHLQTVSSVNLETLLSVPHKSSQNLAHSRHSVRICRIMGIYTYGCWSILEPPSC